MIARVPASPIGMYWLGWYVSLWYGCEVLMLADNKRQQTDVMTEVVMTILVMVGRRSVKTPKVREKILKLVPHPSEKDRFSLGEFFRKTTYNPITINF